MLAAAAEQAEVDQRLLAMQQGALPPAAELQAAVDRCAVWHTQHVRAVELVCGPSFGEVASRLAELHAALPTRLKLAPKMRQLLQPVAGNDPPYGLELLGEAEARLEQAGAAHTSADSNQIAGV